MKKELADIVGSESVFDEDLSLENFSIDEKSIQIKKPNCVVFVKNTEEVQNVVRYANKNSIPITPRSSEVRFYGATIPSQGGILMDLSRMNRILAVDQEDTLVKVEPGVTWPQVQEELEKYGLMVCPPLLPHSKKSVLTSALEREPITIPKFEYHETFLSGELVLGTGDLFYLGSAMGKSHKGGSPEGFLPSARLITGAQGTLGIVTWANLKTVCIPALDKLFFIPFDNLESLVNTVYRVQKVMMGSECFALDSLNLASILSSDNTAFLKSNRAKMAPWTLFICLSGFKRQPQGRIDYEEEALIKISSELGCIPATSLPGIQDSGDKILKVLRRAWKGDKYWKDLYQGSYRDIFFHTTLNRVPEFTKSIEEMARRHDYSVADIGFYLQPIEYGRICSCHYTFHFDPCNPDMVKKVTELFLDASKMVIDMGGFFTNPYGPWAEMVYSRTATFTKVMKVLKNVFDPNNILNPGKLCS